MRDIWVEMCRTSKLYYTNKVRLKLIVKSFTIRYILEIVQKFRKTRLVLWLKEKDNAIDGILGQITVDPTFLNSQPKLLI